MKDIKITISKDGSTVKTEVDGVKGEACTDITKNLMAALGTTEDSGKTNEFYETEDVHNHIGG